MTPQASPLVSIHALSRSLTLRGCLLVLLAVVVIAVAVAVATTAHVASQTVDHAQQSQSATTLSR